MTGRYHIETSFCNWFLYDNGLHHERVKGNDGITNKKFLGYNRLLAALFADISVTLKKIKNFENEKLG